MARTAYFRTILVCFVLYVSQTSTVWGADLLTIPPCVAEFKRGVLNGALPACIENLQKGLRLLRSPSLTVDGKFGENTESAVKFFQRAEGLVEDGWVGPLTRAKLNEEYEKKTRPLPPPPSPTPSPTSPGGGNEICSLVESWDKYVQPGELPGVFSAVNDLNAGATKLQCDILCNALLGSINAVQPITPVNPFDVVTGKFFGVGNCDLGYCTCYGIPFPKFLKQQAKLGWEIVKIVAIIRGAFG